MHVSKRTLIQSQRYAHARQMKRAAKQVKKLKHRSAIEPVIGHLKSDCRLERNYLTGEEGNAINAILSAAGYNFRKLLKELVKLFVLIRIMLQGRMIAHLPSI
ncbi:MAG: transposase [Akkermansia sp.]